MGSTQLSHQLSHLVPQAPSTLQVQDKQKAGSHSQALTYSLPTTSLFGKTFLLPLISVWGKGRLWTPRITGQLFSTQVSKQVKVTMIQFYESHISNSSHIAKTHRKNNQNKTNLWKQNKTHSVKSSRYLKGKSCSLISSLFTDEIIEQNR